MPLPPVSKFPEEPSSLMILVDSCDVVIIVTLRVLETIVSVCLIFSKSALLAGIVRSGLDWKGNEMELKTNNLALGYDSSSFGRLWMKTMSSTNLSILR